MDFLNLDKYDVNYVRDYFLHGIQVSSNLDFIKTKIAALNSYQRLHIIQKILDKDSEDIEIDLSLITNLKVDESARAKKIVFDFDSYSNFYQTEFSIEISDIGIKELFVDNLEVYYHNENLKESDRVIKMHLDAVEIKNKYYLSHNKIMQRLDKLDRNYENNLNSGDFLFNDVQGTIYSLLRHRLELEKGRFNVIVLGAFTDIVQKLAIRLKDDYLFCNNLSNDQKLLLPLLMTVKEYQETISKTREILSDDWNALMNYMNILPALEYRLKGKIEELERDRITIPNLTSINYCIEYQIKGNTRSDYLDELWNAEIKNPAMFEKLVFNKILSQKRLLCLLKEYFSINDLDINSDEKISKFICNIYQSNDQHEWQKVVLQLPKSYHLDFIRIFILLSKAGLLADSKTKIIRVLSKALKSGKRDKLGVRYITEKLKGLSLEGEEIEFEFDQAYKARTRTKSNPIRKALKSILVQYTKE